MCYGLRFEGIRIQYDYITANVETVESHNNTFVVIYLVGIGLDRKLTAMSATPSPTVNLVAGELPWLLNVSISIMSVWINGRIHFTLKAES